MMRRDRGRKIRRAEIELSSQYNELSCPIPMYPELLLDPFGQCEAFGCRDSVAVELQNEVGLRLL